MPPVASGKFFPFVAGAFTAVHVRVHSASGPPPTSTNSWYYCALATNTSTSLDDHFSSFIAREVATGRYRSASEVVRSGLRLLEDQETHMSALRAALIAGEESGQAEPFDFDAFIAAKKS